MDLRTAGFSPVTDGDLPEIVEIHKRHVLFTTATFSERPVPLEELRGVVPVGSPRYPSLVARLRGRGRR